MIDILLIDGPLDGSDTPAKRHAQGMVAAIQSNCAQTTIRSCPVFDDNLSTSATRVTEALFSAVDIKPDIVLCSLGLTRRDSRMVEALDRCMEASVLLVASRPARGVMPVWPAEHSGVFAVQGDARCDASQYSRLGGDLWFGACPKLNSDEHVAGASVAAAHFAGILAAGLLLQGETEALLVLLEEGASWWGRECRRG